MQAFAPFKFLISLTSFILNRQPPEQGSSQIDRASNPWYPDTDFRGRDMEPHLPHYPSKYYVMAGNVKPPTYSTEQYRHT